MPERRRHEGSRHVMGPSASPRAAGGPWRERSPARRLGAWRNRGSGQARAVSRPPWAAWVSTRPGTAPRNTTRSVRCDGIRPVSAMPRAASIQRNAAQGVGTIHRLGNGPGVEGHGTLGCGLELAQCEDGDLRCRPGQQGRNAPIGTGVPVCPSRSRPARHGPRAHPAPPRPVPRRAGAAPRRSPTGCPRAAHCNGPPVVRPRA